MGQLTQVEKILDGLCLMNKAWLEDNDILVPEVFSKPAGIIVKVNRIKFTAMGLESKLFDLGWRQDENDLGYEYILV